MMALTPEIVAGLVVLAGFLLGVVSAAIYFKWRLGVMRTELILSRVAATQQGEKLTVLRVDFDELKSQYIALSAEKGLLDRQLARSESDVHGLRERLEEARADAARKEQASQAVAGRLAAADKDLVELRTVHAEKMAAYKEVQQSFEQTRQQLKTEFQNLANQILDEKGRTFVQNSQTSLEALLKPFREQVEGFQRRVNQVHDETVKDNASLGAEIKRVLEIGLKMSVEANTLAGALKGDKKTIGNWGEIQLERTLQLSGLMKGDHYESQVQFNDAAGNHYLPDFVIKLPDDKHMILDSKVSLVDYDRAVGAATPAEMNAALDAHVKAVRAHIDDLSKKDYSNLIGMHSPNFVLMFMPIEPAYIEAMKHNKELFDYGYQRNVIMVSYTTLMPILRTVANLWMVTRSNEQAHEISAGAADVYNRVCLVAEHLGRLGNTLGTVSTHYNNTVRSLAGKQGLYGKVDRFKTLSAKATRTMPDLQPLHTEIEVERLELVPPAEPGLSQDPRIARQGDGETTPFK